MSRWYNLSKKEAYDWVLIIKFNAVPKRFTAGKIVQLSMMTFADVSIGRIKVCKILKLNFDMYKIYLIHYVLIVFVQ